MNEELADAGLQMLDDIDVVVLPRRGLHVSERREDDVGKRVARSNVREQVSEHRLVASHADGQSVLSRHLPQHREPKVYLSAAVIW
jgi:hypothetical protein